MAKVVINSIAYEVPAEVAAGFEVATERIDSLVAEIADLSAKNDVMQTKLDSAEAESAKLPDLIASAVKARQELVSKATKILAKETVEKMDSMSDEDIRKAVIAARFPEIKLDGKDEQYVSTCFDLAIAAKGPSAIARQRIDSASVMLSEEHTDDAAEYVDPRDEMIQRAKNGYRRDNK